jgi:hypothetical protein
MKKKPLPPFVPLFIETTRSPAWRALSHGAQLLYVALKSRWQIKDDNNGRIYLSHRKAAIELGSNKDFIGRWYRELQFYGFIVMTKYGGLGLNGKGRAAQWRLTELDVNGKPASRDFLMWDGKRFEDRHPSRQLRWLRKKQDPVRQLTDTLSVKVGT